MYVLLGAAASFLVHVNIKSRDDANGQSTFHMNTYFFLLILIENLFLAVSPFLSGDDGYIKASKLFGENRQNLLIAMPFVIFALWVLSCLFIMIFYKVFGHPWTDLNGPTNYSCKELICGCNKKVTTVENSIELAERPITKPDNPGIDVESRVGQEQSEVGPYHDCK